ncbi:hypothetical protein [Blastococcus goldschmidtiae]|uniref:Uncharacterized protein n=1 Tax=Blastococcus goldschmidtiae TaxID=3075546 RepID=A0ABU2K6D4_9ACTN|nr:hypothetical protein [Blastococcus sp. DSM 46792]MDT0275745.1 hypothetical protein [Blastococcus sp. DSM 46792]
MRRSDQVSGATSRGARAARELIVGAALVLALAGCSGSPEEVVRTSGALADGFEIEPGSGLVGAVFPRGAAGQLAVLRVDGDLPRVFEGYVRQAEELGYPVGSEGGGVDAECSGPDDGEDDQIVGDDATEDDPVEGRFRTECAASGLEMSESEVSVLSVRGLGEADGTGYIVLETDQHSNEVPERPALAAEGPVASPTDDELAPDLAPSTDVPPLHIVEGSELVTDPLPSGCTTGGYVAVLEVTGELMPVMRGYLEQFTDTTGFTSEGLVGDDEEPRVIAEAAGGGSLNALGVAGDPSYVLIERCND